MTPLLSGLALGFSLIVAIGAQNVFVLRQGMRRQHVWVVVLVCALSDAVLIAAGVAGVGVALEALPWLVDAARWLGAAFLIGYGLMAARRAWRPTGSSLEGEDPVIAAGPPATASVVATALALTWLNPHVYLDTVFLLGSIAGTHGDGRWLFAAGAITASFAWFFALGFGARYMGRWLQTPRSWRTLDGVIAVVMVGLGVSLVLPVLPVLA